MEYYVKKKVNRAKKNIDEIHIMNDQTEISFINHGARINRWVVNENKNIVLGFDYVDDFFTDDFKYFGATIGRVAGRIKDAAFELHGHTYQLNKSENKNHLHGGSTGYNDVIWDYEIETTSNQIKVSFFYRDADGMNGYPGNIDVQVDYTYDNDNKLTIDYHALSDENTLFSPTNHVYFNLSGNTGSILDHELKINSDGFIPLFDDGIPTGIFQSVSNTPFDFRMKQRIETVIHSKHPQIQLKNGIDHPFVLNKDGKNSAELSFKEHKIILNTDQKAVVVYTLNKTGEQLTVWDNPLKPHHGIALEAQDIPNSINQTTDSDSILLKDQPYKRTTTYQYVNMENTEESP